MFFRWSEMQFDNTHYSIKACGDWMWEHALAGWRPYFIVFMFKPLNGSEEGVIAQMERAVERDFYSSLCKRFSRHPNQPSQQDKLPMMWLYPDLPVWRTEKKTSIWDMQFNCNGLHYNGALMLPPKSRFKGDIIKHIDGYQDVYVRWPIERIHVQEVELNDINYVADYAGKSLKSNRVSPDDVIILPDRKGSSTAPAMTQEERAAKDYQSRHNVSDDVLASWLKSEARKLAKA